MSDRIYYYVGPAALRDATNGQPAGTHIDSVAKLRDWLTTSQMDRSSDGTIIATFTINLDGHLFLAHRRSEHVACAAGGPVLSAGEISFDHDFIVTEVSNQSTGFCPEPESWMAVANALDEIGVNHPKQFTTAVVFRRCPNCGERNIVKDDWFHCAICDSELPRHWNFSDNECAE